MSPVDPIDKLCLDPRDTRRRAALGELTPCFRCIAYRPDTKTGCHFVERRTVPMGRRTTSPLRQPQQLMLPTSDTIEKGGQ